MKKIKLILIVFVLALGFSGCKEKKTVPQLRMDQARYICELATMECRYHNVAKYNEKDAQGALFWKKDKNFWVEYDALVRLGIDVSLVDIKVNGNDVTISIPKGKILGEIRVDKTSIKDESYIVEPGTAPVEADDIKEATKVSNKRLKEKIESDNTLLKEAQDRAKVLLENYVNSIGRLGGQTYNITWVEVDNEGRPIK